MRAAVRIGHHKGVGRAAGIRNMVEGNAIIRYKYTIIPHPRISQRSATSRIGIPRTQGNGISHAWADRQRTTDNGHRLANVQTNFVGCDRIAAIVARYPIAGLLRRIEKVAKPCQKPVAIPFIVTIWIRILNTQKRRTTFADGVWNCRDDWRRGRLFQTNTHHVAVAWQTAGGVTQRNAFDTVKNTGFP